MPRPRLEPSKAMVRADEVFVAEGHEATRYPGGFLPLQWLVAGWCGKQLHKVTIGVADIYLLEPIGSRLWSSGDWYAGGVQLLNGLRAVIQGKGHMVTTGCQGSSRIGGATGSTFLTLQDHMDLGVPGLEPEAGKGEIGTGSRFHPENVLIEMTTGLQVRRDDGDVINGPDLEKREVDHAGMMEKHSSAGKGN